MSARSFLSNVCVPHITPHVSFLSLSFVNKISNLTPDVIVCNVNGSHDKFLIMCEMFSLKSACVNTPFHLHSIALSKYKQVVDFV